SRGPRGRAGRSLFPIEATLIDEDSALLVGPLMDLASLPKFVVSSILLLTVALLGLQSNPTPTAALIRFGAGS
ncbi:hypothetical protein THAOC_37715, partial [Thalassiosira oceanica]